MNPTLKSQIESLCAKVQEVIDNNDWPTEEGHCMLNNKIWRNL